MVRESIALNIFDIFLSKKGMFTQELISELQKTRNLKDPNAIVSQNLKILEEKGVIERRSIPKPGTRGPDPKFNKLKTDHNGFMKIVEYIYNIKNRRLRHEYQKKFIQSNFARDRINMGLIDELENHLDEKVYPHPERIELTEIEKKTILNILQSSISAIHYAFIESGSLGWNFVNNEPDIQKFKQSFISYLMLRLGEDLLSDTTNEDELNYEICVEFSDIERYPKLIVKKIE